MPLPLPNLDDRTFTDLSVELRSLIPRYDKSWTNHNPSDPGITLLELFAWLAEMALYRINRIEKWTYLAFLEMIGVQPSGPQTVVTFEINVPKAALPVSFVLARGTRVAARDERSGEEIVFETTTDVPYSEENWDEDLLRWVFKVPVVNTEVIENELPGVSNGAPNQEFGVKQGPLYLVREQESYEGNPAVTVDGVTWHYKADLLSSGPADPDFTVEQLAGLIRFGDKFGDNVNGKVPPAGSKILCTYRRLGGAAGNVAAGKITTLLDPPTGISLSAVTVFNEYAATGGVDSETLDDLLARGLAALQERSRAVSDEDFEYLAQQAEPDKVSRVLVVADRNLEGTTPNEEGHISVVILPSRDYLGLPEHPVDYDPVAKTFTPNRTCAAVTAALAGPNIKRLKQAVFRFLDQRRLITTIIHVVEPAFTALRLNVTLQAGPGVNTEVLKKNVGDAIAAFLDPYEGWEDQQGWQFGRNVYRSELYQYIESIEGVDHVSELIMNGDATTSLITVGENNLMCLDELTIAVS